MGILVAMLVMLVLGALGGAVTYTSVAETQIVGNYRASTQALYAADLAIEIVVNHLVTVPDWTLVHAGVVASPFVDGPPGGMRQTPAGAVDLAALTNFVRSGPTARMWQLYAYAPLRNLAPVPSSHPDVYVIVWASGAPGAPGSTAALLLAQAYAPYGVRRAIEAMVERTPVSGIRITARREVR